MRANMHTHVHTRAHICTHSQVHESHVSQAEVMEQLPLGQPVSPHETGSSSHLGPLPTQCHLQG